MNTIHAGITIGVTELRESPTRILKRAEDEDQAVAILNHNKPAGYIISPKMMEAMLDSIADRIAENRASCNCFLKNGRSWARYYFSTSLIVITGNQQSFSHTFSALDNKDSER
jgi:antitoxin StbD